MTYPVNNLEFSFQNVCNSFPHKLVEVWEGHFGQTVRYRLVRVASVYTRYNKVPSYKYCFSSISRQRDLLHTNRHTHAPVMCLDLCLNLSECLGFVRSLRWAAFRDRLFSPEAPAISDSTAKQLRTRPRENSFYDTGVKCLWQDFIYIDSIAIESDL